jgi:parvulin-like peptidyl-prolyl isomerase/arsenate reductase-like glutaredoxin family protein
MLSDMRRYLRAIMIVVAAAFVAGFLMSELWQLLSRRGDRRGRDTSGLVAMIGTHKVTPEEYRAAVSYMTDRFKRDNRLRDLSNDDYATVENQAWRFLTTEITWSKVLKDAKINITQEELLEIMRANPPEALSNRPELMTDGKLDPQKYQQAMNSPEYREVFTEYYRSLVEMLPKEKFRLDVLNAARIPSGEITDALADANTKWRTTSLYFGPGALKERPQPTEEEAKAYYEAHKDEFTTKEMRQLKYVLFPLRATNQDTLDARETIDRAFAQLQKGETFNLTALDYSDIEGDTLSSMVPRRQLDPTTDSILARLKVGTYSVPYLAPYGWQIVLLDNAKKESLAFRRILVRVKLGTEPLAAARDSVRGFVEKVTGATFDSLAQASGLAVSVTPPIRQEQEDMSSPAIESPSQVLEWTWRAKTGDVLDRPQRSTQAYVIFQMGEVTAGGFQEYDKVKQAAMFRVRQQKEKTAWLARATEALGQLKSGKTLEQYAAENPGVELQTDSFVGLDDVRRRKGPEFAGAVAALGPGEKCGVIETNWGAFITRCEERTPGQGLDPQTYADQRRQQVAQQLMGEMLKQPKIRDFRDALGY